MILEIYIEEINYNSKIKKKAFCSHRDTEVDNSGLNLTIVEQVLVNVLIVHDYRMSWKARPKFFTGPREE